MRKPLLDVYPSLPDCAAGANHAMLICLMQGRHNCPHPRATCVDGDQEDHGRSRLGDLGASVPHRDADVVRALSGRRCAHMDSW